MAQNLSNDHINLTMLTDFYEITMANGYFTNGFKDTIGYFDMFFRKVPDGGGFAIMAGVEQLVNYLSELSFTQEDIDYLRSKHIFREEFLDYLKNFKFTCDVWAVPEGTPIFPGEPIVTVRGPVIQAQFVETMVCCPSTTRASSQRRQTASCALRTAERLWSSAPAVHRALTAPFMARVPHISAAASALPAPSATAVSAFRRSVPWRTAGYSFLTANTKRLKRMPKNIRTTARCSSIHTTY